MESERELQSLIEQEAAKLKGERAAPWLCLHGFHKWSCWQVLGKGRYEKNGRYWESSRRFCVRCGKPELKESHE
jgi:hypothetical protein